MLCTAALATLAACAGPRASSDEPSGTTAVRSTAPSTDTGSGGTTPPSTADSGAPTNPTAAIPAAFDVQATLVGGGAIDLGDYAGAPLAVWFWAPT